MKAPLYFGLWIYRTLLILALPLISFRLWWRGQMDPAYQSRWRERFGFYDASLTKRPIWFHTVSAGETIAAAQPFAPWQIFIAAMTQQRRFWSPQ